MLLERELVRDVDAILITCTHKRKLKSKVCACVSSYLLTPIWESCPYVIFLMCMYSRACSEIEHIEHCMCEYLCTYGFNESTRVELFDWTAVDPWLLGLRLLDWSVIPMMMLGECVCACVCFKRILQYFSVSSPSYTSVVYMAKGHGVQHVSFHWEKNRKPIYWRLPYNGRLRADDGAVYRCSWKIYFLKSS